MLRLVGFLIFIFGVYLIFAEQIFFGVLSIILAFLIFPNRSGIKSHHYNYDNDYSNDYTYSSDSDSGGGDSGGGGGSD
ncbi:hypothetical protein [Neobacillus niacini]|uniref:hypothetical protein n=1 Tax=Neobacillus niacini TaxID=86668 RepID=UPI00286B9C42|nr:hypothetical protein [Neobacillus niacini]